MKINLCHCQFILMSSNVYVFLRPLLIGTPSRWLNIVSRSRLSPSTGLCWTRHPPTIADHHDTPAVTGGLHPLLDIAPKNRRTTAQPQTSVYVSLHTQARPRMLRMSVIASFQKCPRRGSDRVRTPTRGSHRITSTDECQFSKKLPVSWFG